MCPHRLTTRKLESDQRTSPSHRTPPSLLASTSQVSTKPTFQNSPSWSTSMAEACLKCVFSFNHQRYLNSLVAQAQVVAVSFEYRLAPEHLLPIAYEDCWAALQWVALHSLNNGANIVHNIAMRVDVESLHGGVKIFGAFLNHPLFWGSKPIGAPGGIDNPLSPGALSLAGLGCSRVLVAVAEKDKLRDTIEVFLTMKN
uniref:Alpha/beta hydrolase fold-3 domain-containing protein n=1 Tax=Quercus lobata TaxID=97700 RepID=A0A7N2LVS1_QUELO